MLELALRKLETVPVILLLEEVVQFSTGGFNEAKYFLVMDLVRILGPAKGIPRHDLVAIQGLMVELIKQAFRDVREIADLPLPQYPSLNVDGVNVFHVVALYTSKDNEKAELFFTALKRAGIASKAHLRAVCGALKSTPLHLAAENGNSSFVDLILANDPNQIMIRNSQGMTAADVAASNIASVLKEKESEYRRRKQLKGAAKEVIASTNSSSTPDESITNAITGEKSERKNAFTSMLEVLKGYNSGAPSARPAFPSPPGSVAHDPRFVMYSQSLLPPSSVSSTSREVTEVTGVEKLIKGICHKVPGGEIYGNLYAYFLLRLGIDKLPMLRAQMYNPMIACKFPPWLKRAIENEIDASAPNSNPTIFFNP